MTAIIDGKYEIEVLEPKRILGHDEIRITYSSKRYPELYEYLKTKFLEKETILYRDEIQEMNLVLEGASIVEKMDIPDDVMNEDIDINEKTYGTEGIMIPLEERKEFIQNQAYGTIKIYHKKGA